LTYNTSAIAQNNYAAAKYALLDQKQKEAIEVQTFRSQIQSLQTHFALAKKNEDLMLENTKLSNDMFKNGSINAQTLADAITKYLEAFIILHNLELQLIDMHAKKLTKQSIDIFEVLFKHDK
jgi:hypothetical protein